MADPKSNVDFFGSYLSRVSGGDEGISATGNPEQELLHLLATFSSPVPIKYLMAHTTLAPSIVMKTLESLREAKLADILSTPEDESVVITDFGRKIFGPA